MNYLHLVKDEKFVDFFSSIFQHKSISNRYIVHSKSKDRKINYLKDTLIYKTVSSAYYKSNDFSHDTDWADIIIVHYLTNEIIQNFSILKTRNIVWSGWGADYYDLIYSREQLLGTETLKLSNKSRSFKNKIIDAFGYNNNKYQKLKIDLLSKIDFFSSPIPNDYNLLINKYPDFRAEYVQLNYASIEESFSNSVDINPRHILVGNSAHLTNNHIEIFNILSKLDLNEYKVIVPLSYGNRRYRNQVIKHGLKILGESFEPLINYMPLEEYNNVIGQCGHVFMNHKRQQAIGNIGCSLVNGSSLYLNESNPLFDFLSKLGINVINIDDFTSKDLLIDQDVFKRNALYNTNLLKSFWGAKKITDNVNNFINIMAQRIKE